MRLHIGIDDTDSGRGGCTTYVGYRITTKLIGRGVRVLDYPRLLRLNPNVPWKTRGNGAVGLTVEAESLDDISGVLQDEMDLAFRKYGSTPACVVITEPLRTKLQDFFTQAVNRIIDIDHLPRLLEGTQFPYVWVSRKQGLIGALAAASNLLDYGDHTFEVLAYRQQKFIGTPRNIDPVSVKNMDRVYASITFNNVDGDRILIAPHGKDPVLLGIRGEDPNKLLEALAMIKSEPREGAMVFKTNQGTDMHYATRRLKEVRLGDSISLQLRVLEYPVISLGGHVFLTLTDGENKIKAAFYWETGEVRKAASLLMPGDMVTVFGGVKVSVYPTINVEKLLINKLERIYVHENPLCPKCFSTSESIGKNKGYRCRRCKTLVNGGKIIRIKNRSLTPGLYLPPLRYFRHLMKPLKRYGKEKQGYHFTTDPFKQLL